MTRDEIMNMPAGREIEILVSEKIFNEPRFIKCGNCGSEVDRFNTSQCEICYSDNLRIPAYSLDISAAWDVVEKICRDNPDYEFWIEKTSRHVDFGIHINDNSHGTWTRAGGEESTRVSDADSPSLPLAICRAALLAVMDGKS